VTFPEELEVPHDRWGACYCPNFCPLWKDFWAYRIEIRPEGLVRCEWHPDFSPCILDESLPDAYLVWRESFNFDEPPKVSTDKLHGMIQRWLETTPFLGITYADWLEKPQYQFDDYTKVHGVVLTETSAEIFFRRMCPMWFVRKLFKIVFAEVDISKFSSLILKHPLLKLPPWTKDGITFTEMNAGLIGVIIDHFRWEPTELAVAQTKGEKLVPRQHFKGMILPVGEADIQQRMFLDFIKENFPGWRHRTA